MGRGEGRCRVSKRHSGRRDRYRRETAAMETQCTKADAPSPPLSVNQRTGRKEGGGEAWCAFRPSFVCSRVQEVKLSGYPARILVNIVNVVNRIKRFGGADGLDR